MRAQTKLVNFTSELFKFHTAISNQRLFICGPYLEEKSPLQVYHISTIL